MKTLVENGYLTAYLAKSSGKNKAAFWQACPKKLTPRQFRLLIRQGYCYYNRFSHRPLILALRFQKCGSGIDINIVAIDIRSKRVVGYRDIEIAPGQAARCWGSIALPFPFSQKTTDKLVKLGFTPSEVDAVRQIPEPIRTKSYAGWAAEEFRGQNGLFSALVNAAAKICQGFSVPRLQFRGVGGDKPEVRQKLMAHYSHVFAAQVVSATEGMMVIEL